MTKCQCLLANHLLTSTGTGEPNCPNVVTDPNRTTCDECWWCVP